MNWFWVLLALWLTAIVALGIGAFLFFATVEIESHLVEDSQVKSEGRSDALNPQSSTKKSDRLFPSRP
jgi:hypothetical protein